MNISFLFLVSAAVLAAQPAFREHVLAEGLTSGYQVVVHDVNRDGRPDLIALASGVTELVWFENPHWERRVLATGVSRMINLAACAGMREIVIAQAFANVPKNSIGIVSVLTPGADFRQPWTVKEIDRLATSHRLRCADIEGNGRVSVINAPLAGERADAPDYRDHVPLVMYRPGEWKRIPIGAENEGVVHGIYIYPWSGGRRDSVLTASFLGIHEYEFKNGRWSRHELAKGDPAAWPKSGSSDIAIGRLGRNRFIASIEPWHGHQIAVYTAGKDKTKWLREVIDDTFVDGHTIYTGDFDKDGRDEIVVGYRGKDRSVAMYRWNAGSWKKTLIDDGGIAAAGCAIADLNADRLLDVACIGSATANLKWYENVGKSK